MADTSRSFSYRFFSRWAAFSYQNSVWIILIALLVAVASGIYTVRNLGVDTDTNDMLSEDLPFRINHGRYKEAFPQYEDTMLLVLDAPTPEQAFAMAKQITTNLQQDKVHIQEAYYAGGDPFLERNGLLYKSMAELENITDRLAAAQPLVARIADNPTLDTFASVLTEAIDELRTGRKLDLEQVLNGVSATLEAQFAGAPRALSWQELFTGETQKASYQELVMIQPKLDYTLLFAAEQPLAAIRAAAQDMGLTDDAAEKLRITGSVALAHDELYSAMRGAQDGGLLALVMVTVVLFMALRTVGAVVTVLVSLILGLLLTAAFATAAVGHLNLISIAFAVLYIGLGVDYAIHFLLRHQELKNNDQPILGTLCATSGDIGRALTVCAVTTAIGFYAFMPTTYRGVAELGLISGTGMLISLIVTLTLAPALQRYLPIQARQMAARTPSIIAMSFARLLELPRQLRKTVFVATLAVLFAAVMALPQIKFDYNLLNLNDPQRESVRTFRELLADAEDSPWHAIVLADDEQETKQIAERLTVLYEVDKVVTIFDLVPTEQEMKHFLINEMALTLGPITVSTPLIGTGGDGSMTQQRQSLETLKHALDRFIVEQPDHSAAMSVRELSASLTKLLAQLNTISIENRNNVEPFLDAISRDLLGLLPDALERLQIALEAQPFTLKELPTSLREYWHSQNDVYRIAVYPAENINDNDALRRFVHAVQHETPQVTGVPVISLEAGEAVMAAFIHAFSLALIGVVLALLVLLRNITSTILVLIPLLLAALFTSAATVWLGVPFNFANIIALPLLLGIGIDCSIHMVHRSRNSESRDVNLLHTSTARAIFYSSLTTLAGFGSLAFSPHQGTASMGLLLAVGVVLTLICVLVILPALLHSIERREVEG
ncbi:MAG: MMPL family transporter [Coxiellaceae bacterium]|nr:MMPL family transporter [Coxiellaceae bacterium]MDP1950527.1 MMPL family transporter [Nitrosomonas sp.]